MTGLNRKIILFGSLLLIVVMSSGCVMTKGDYRVLDDKLNTIRKDQKEILTKVNYLDSLISADAEASLLLKANLNSAISELTQQFSMTQTNLNDVQSMLAQLLKNPSGQQFSFPTQLPLKADSTNVPVDTAAKTTASAPGMSAVDCQELYDESFINIRNGQYEDAISGFNDYLRMCAVHGQSDNARFWTGEAYYSMEKFKEALSEFDLLLKDFPKSEKRASSMYKMARCYEELGQSKDATQWYQKIVDDFPESLEAKQARDKLDELKARKG